MLTAAIKICASSRFAAWRGILNRNSPSSNANASALPGERALTQKMESRRDSTASLQARDARERPLKRRCRCRCLSSSRVFATAKTANDAPEARKLRRFLEA
ncbi:MAG: hypothetical protein CO113_15470 [Elusimicrobia bacterium CG_4_9_14_3_um_filter_62_55]|nr:MAG: hypothetical protein CO113_15470 [Elusimicrobia bacterium CG_4_9_14_3_um_filter_62_55]